jgi:arylsulfatase A-like enzyme
MRRFLFLALAVLAGNLDKAAAHGKAEHVVVIIWDGMRPDFVSPQYTPTLYDLARRGTFFMRNHCAYVSTTEVNGTALATGMQPDHSGVIANAEYRPDLNWLSSYGTEALEIVRRADMASQGHYLLVPTVTELLHTQGIPTAVAGAKPIALLQDRAPKKVSAAEKASVTLFRGQTLPRSVLDTLVKARDIGAFPGTTNTESADGTLGSGRGGRRGGGGGGFGQAAAAAGTNATPASTTGDATRAANSVDSWTTKALVRGLWRNSVPKYSLLWLSEPDAAQHDAGVGSESAINALQSSDEQLASVIKVLEEKEALETTDIFVVSDHGFSTISRGPDIIESLKKSKFTAGRQFQNPEPGDILVDNLGGSTFFYVFEHEPKVIQRLVAYLQGTDYAGVIFCSEPMDGTFPLAQVHLAVTNGAPDVVVSMRWTAEQNEYGAPGLLTAVDGKAGKGTHGSLSPFDLHNTLIAAGPDFKEGFVDDLPTGNIDVAPTALFLLGVTPPQPLDGRVLHEALTGEQPPVPKPLEQKLEASRNLGFLGWTQYLKLTRMGYTIYYDEGNGECRLRREPTPSLQ